MKTPLRTINKYLSIYQLIGFITAFIVLTLFCLEQGRMAVLYIPIVGGLFLPFVIVSCTALLNREREEKRIRTILYVGLLFLLIPTLSLPFVTDLSEWISVFSILFIVLLTMIFTNDLDLQLLVMNSVGTILLTLIIAICIWITTFW